MKFRALADGLEFIFVDDLPTEQNPINSITKYKKVAILCSGAESIPAIMIGQSPPQVLSINDPDNPILEKDVIILS